MIVNLCTHLLLASLHAWGESGEGRSWAEVVRGGPDTMSEDENGIVGMVLESTDLYWGRISYSQGQDSLSYSY